MNPTPETSDFDRGEKKTRNAPTLVFLAVGALILAIAAVGTVYALIADTRGSKKDRGEVFVSNPSAVLELGALRFSPKDRPQAAFVATVTLGYDLKDPAFAEEVSGRADFFRETATRLLSGKSYEDLGPAFRGSIKAELRDAFSSALVLGKISEVWFEDFAGF